MTHTLERLFHLSEQGTTVRTEFLAGSTTFLTLAYIIFVQPTVLSAMGMDFGAVFVATCVASGVATTMMAFFANYPIAVAPAMGHNFYFAFTVVVAGGVAVAGALFVLTAGIGLRERLITAIPNSLKHAIAVGIGLLIAMVGLQWAGLIVDSPGTLVALGDLRTIPVVVAVLGFTVMAVLMAWNVRAALLVGLLVSSLAAWVTGLTTFQGVASIPPSLTPTLFQLDVVGAFHPDMIAVILVFFFLALFFSPLVAMVGGGYQVSNELTLHPTIAPALVVVGTMMVRNVRHVGWDDPTEAIPAFLTIIMMPLTVSITEGIGFGFISFAILRLFTGRAAETDWMVYLLAGLFLVRYIALV